MKMKKMLVADNTEINRSILYSIFASQYDLIQTESSDEVFKCLMENHDDISVIIINEYIAARLSSESVRTLSALKIFDDIPVIMIIDNDSSHIKKSLRNL